MRVDVVSAQIEWNTRWPHLLHAANCIVNNSGYLYFISRDAKSLLWFKCKILLWARINNMMVTLLKTYKHVSCVNLRTLKVESGVVYCTDK